jgi:hypothetical protein
LSSLEEGGVPKYSELLWSKKHDGDEWRAIATSVPDHRALTVNLWRGSRLLRRVNAEDPAEARLLGRLWLSQYSLLDA